MKRCMNTFPNPNESDFYLRVVFIWELIFYLRVIFIWELIFYLRVVFIWELFFRVILFQWFSFESGSCVHLPESEGHLLWSPVAHEHPLAKPSPQEWLKNLARKIIKNYRQKKWFKKNDRIMIKTRHAYLHNFLPKAIIFLVPWS